MNPNYSSSFDQFPTGSYHLSIKMNYPFSGSTVQSNPPQGELTSSPTTIPKIHVNPKMCAPRNIYINKAFTSSTGTVLNPLQKPDRVYYNPDFFKNNAKTAFQQQSEVLPNIKREPNIHINPNFFKKEGNNCSNPLSSSGMNGTTLEKSSACGIHVNPIFLKNISPDVNPTVSITTSVNERLNPCVPTTSTPRQKYISKYKIVKKKICPPVINGVSILRKPNVKINQIPARRTKIKIVRGKLLKYVSQTVLDQRLKNKNKNLILKNIAKQKTDAVGNIFYRNPTVFPPRILNSKFKLIMNVPKATPPNSFRKSVLQQKIESRRKVKSNLFSSISKYQYKSKYKYVRTPQNTSQKQYNSGRKLYSKYKYIKDNGVCPVPEKNLSEFKRISRNKLVRKSVLQKQIESRMKPRKSSQETLSPQKLGCNLSKYKFVRIRNESFSSKNKSDVFKTKLSKLKRSSMFFSSEKYRSEKVKKVAVLTKKLRKNNQPCLFYNRFGHCKGKDRGTCQKLHDPKYITICKRFVKGECTDEKCTLSHDIRPEKMPTCHHYLSGLCKKTDCPYLHIKVNQKAPICRAFLQGFCADVFNCTKRHEFICPSFAEKGSCLRGKACCFPHRVTETRSKLLGANQFPLLNRKKAPTTRPPHAQQVSKANTNVSSDHSPIEEGPPMETKAEFTRYFLTPLADSESKDSSDNSNDSDDDSSEDSSSGETEDP